MAQWKILSKAQAANKIKFVDIEIPKTFSKELDDWANRANVVDGPITFHLADDFNIAGGIPVICGVAIPLKHLATNAKSRKAAAQCSTPRTARLRWHGGAETDRFFRPPLA